jgi:hypothetical protein
MTVLLFASCDTKLRNLTMKKDSYFGNELRIDGYYYSSSDLENDIGIAVFYRDGVCIHMFTRLKSQDTLNFVENDILLNNALMSHLWRDPACIGVFHVNMAAIEFETWEARSPFRHFGEILNDTTFLLTKRVNVRQNHSSSPNLIYQFKQFCPKPDSTNVFIK